MSVLKKGSEGTTQLSSDSANDLEDETSNDNPRRTFNISCNVSKLVGGGAACRLH